MQAITRYFEALWEVTLEAAPWLLIGLVAAGLIKTLVPADWMSRWLGKRGLGSIIRAAVIGTPLPLCSCGVLPAAMGLRRAGASRGATVSFLVATPENGADSIAMTYALLGPFMTVVRPVAALFSAIIAGLLAEVFPGVVHPGLEADGAAGASKPQAATSCCGSNSDPEPEPKKSCCGSIESTASASPGWVNRAGAGLRYATTRIIDDISIWLAVGLAAAAAITAFVPQSFLETWGTGTTGLFVMLIVGLPMYICAVASTPVAASLLIGGVSPGAVLVFLLAGPATNIGSIIIVKRELGLWPAVGYLLGVCGGALAFGFAVNAIADSWDIGLIEQAEHAHEMIPQWISIACAAVLVFIAVPPLRRLVMRDTTEARLGSDDKTE